MPWRRASLNGGNVVVRGGEAVLEGEGVEEDEAADAQGGGAVLFLIGLGDDVGDAPGQAGVRSDRTGGRLEGVADDGGGCCHLVDAFEVQGEGAQFIGEFADGAVPNGRLGRGPSRGSRAATTGGRRFRGRPWCLRRAEAGRGRGHRRCRGRGESRSGGHRAGLRGGCDRRPTCTRRWRGRCAGRRLMSGAPLRLRRSARAERPWSRRSWARRTLAASSRMVSGWDGMGLAWALAGEGRDWICDWSCTPARMHVSFCSFYVCSVERPMGRAWPMGDRGPPGNWLYGTRCEGRLLPAPAVLRACGGWGWGTTGRCVKGERAVCLNRLRVRS